ncbi:MAG: hypothetical protein COA33_001350 [Fluviicola sp.]|nr:hypothetical protein [Fluviicola sp.]
MSDFFKEFSKVSKEEWVTKIEADLKGKDPDLLVVNDAIEDIQFSTYYHNEDSIAENELPGNYPNKRGMNKPSNAFQNGKLILIQNEKEANKKALHALNSGADLLIFKTAIAKTEWKIVLEGIRFEYIHTQFVVQSVQEFETLHSLLQKEANIQYNIDFHEDSFELNDLTAVAQNFKINQQRFCAVNGFKIQQAGGNAWQEIAFSLSTAHEYLVKLMAEGFSIDEASACVTFNLGIGSNYFLETAKFRSLKQLWSKIVRAYSPEHSCSYNCHITAVTTHLNKSLKDPHTNLLRQTTEAMSAVNAGVDALAILPYDIFSSNGESELAERTALNISSILAEESYFDKVIDPLGGSYSIEKLTELVGRKAWAEFQQIDAKGGLFNSEILIDFTQKVTEKRNLRIAFFNEGKITGIGMNIYPPNEEMKNDWAYEVNYLNLKPLILEREYKTVNA